MGLISSKAAFNDVRGTYEYAYEGSHRHHSAFANRILEKLAASEQPPTDPPENIKYEEISRRRRDLITRSGKLGIPGWLRYFKTSIGQDNYDPAVLEAIYRDAPGAVLPYEPVSRSNAATLLRRAALSGGRDTSWLEYMLSRSGMDAHWHDPDETKALHQRGSTLIPGSDELPWDSITKSDRAVLTAGGSEAEQRARRLLKSPADPFYNPDEVHTLAKEHLSSAQYADLYPEAAQPNLVQAAVDQPTALPENIKYEEIPRRRRDLITRSGKLGIPGWLDIFKNSSSLGNYDPAALEAIYRAAPDAVLPYAPVGRSNAAMLLRHAAVSGGHDTSLLEYMISPEGRDHYWYDPDETKALHQRGSTLIPGSDELPWDSITKSDRAVLTAGGSEAEQMVRSLLKSPALSFYNPDEVHTLAKEHLSLEQYAKLYPEAAQPNLVQAARGAPAADADAHPLPSESEQPSLVDENKLKEARSVLDDAAPPTETDPVVRYEKAMGALKELRNTRPIAAASYDPKIASVLKELGESYRELAANVTLADRAQLPPPRELIGAAVKGASHVGDGALKAHLQILSDVTHKLAGNVRSRLTSASPGNSINEAMSLLVDNGMATTYPDGNGGVVNDLAVVAGDESIPNFDDLEIKQPSDPWDNVRQLSKRTNGTHPNLKALAEDPEMASKLRNALIGMDGPEASGRLDAQAVSAGDPEAQAERTLDKVRRRASTLPPPAPEPSPAQLPETAPAQLPTAPHTPTGSAPSKWRGVYESIKRLGGVNVGPAAGSLLTGVGVATSAYDGYTNPKAQYTGADGKPLSGGAMALNNVLNPFSPIAAAIAHGKEMSAARDALGRDTPADREFIQNFGEAIPGELWNSIKNFGNANGFQPAGEVYDDKGNPVLQNSGALLTSGVTAIPGAFWDAVTNPAQAGSAIAQPAWALYDYLRGTPGASTDNEYLKHVAQFPGISGVDAQASAALNNMPINEDAAKFHEAARNIQSGKGGDEDRRVIRSAGYNPDSIRPYKTNTASNYSSPSRTEDKNQVGLLGSRGMDIVQALMDSRLPYPGMVEQGPEAGPYAPAAIDADATIDKAVSGQLPTDPPKNIKYDEIPSQHRDFITRSGKLGIPDWLDYFKNSSYLGKYDPAEIDAIYQAAPDAVLPYAPVGRDNAEMLLRRAAVSGGRDKSRLEYMLSPEGMHENWQDPDETKALHQRGSTMIPGSDELPWDSIAEHDRDVLTAGGSEAEQRARLFLKSPADPFYNPEDVRKLVRKNISLEQYAKLYPEAAQSFESVADTAFDPDKAYADYVKTKKREAGHQSVESVADTAFDPYKAHADYVKTKKREAVSQSLSGNPEQALPSSGRASAEHAKWKPAVNKTVADHAAGYPGAVLRNLSAVPDTAGRLGDPAGALMQFASSSVPGASEWLNKQMHRPDTKGPGRQYHLSTTDAWRNTKPDAKPSIQLPWTGTASNALGNAADTVDSLLRGSAGTVGDVLKGDMPAAGGSAWKTVKNTGSGLWNTLSGAVGDVGSGLAGGGTIKNPLSDYLEGRKKDLRLEME